jgi:hypothetical protein
MKVERSIEVRGAPGDELLLGAATWNDEDRSVKYNHPDRNGNRSKHAEFPLFALDQAVLFAAGEGYLSHEQLVAIGKGLAELLP